MKPNRMYVLSGRLPFNEQTQAGQNDDRVFPSCIELKYSLQVTIQVC